MALIECPECRREVSSRAAACPTCAYPIATRSAAPAPEGAPPKWRRRLLLAVQVAARLIVGFVLFGIGVDEGSDAGAASAFGGLLIAGSSIPVLYRAWMGRPGTPDSSEVEERMAAMEQRHREQMAALAQMQADQIADLEERIDFTERLLTKQRDQPNP